MTMGRLLTAAVVVVTTPSSAIYAGPCSQEIDRVQAKFDAKLEARAAVAPGAPESAAATAHHQPTPNSIAAAEAELGILSPEQAEGVTEALGQAREADEAGDQSVCEQAVLEAQRALGK